MEEINNENLLEEEKVQKNAAQEENTTVEEPDATEETVEDTPFDTPDFVEPNTAEPENGGKTSKRTIIITVAVVAIVAAVVAIVLAATGKFSKYPGFKKDRETGLYYQFYDDIHDTAAMPKTGDLVGILFSLRTADSTLIPMIPNQMVMDSVYESDIFAALRMMHVGDSATFIMNGAKFFEKMFEGQEYPFGDEPLYLDVKLFGRMDKVSLEKAQNEYMQTMKQKQAEEAELIVKYVKDNNIKVAPTEQGLYIVKTKKGTGPKLEMMQTVKVHYTGKLLDGTVFDSSIERGEPIEVMLGAGQVIPGWEAALSQMSVGDKATIIIPSNMAYGERGTGNGAIEPYSPLVFDMEVIGLSDAKVQQ